MGSWLGFCHSGRLLNSIGNVALAVPGSTAHHHTRTDRCLPMTGLRSEAVIQNGCPLPSFSDPTHPTTRRRRSPRSGQPRSHGRSPLPRSVTLPGVPESGPTRTPGVIRPSADARCVVHYSAVRNIGDRWMFEERPYQLWIIGNCL
jgi:hypothetical protein